MSVNPQKAMCKYLKKLAAEIERVAADPKVEAVHDLRVSVRRAVQAIRVFESELPAGATGKLRRRINKIRDQAALVRDRDVIYELLQKHQLPDFDPACSYLRGERAMAAMQLQEAMRKLIKQRKPKQWIVVMESCQ